MIGPPSTVYGIDTVSHGHGYHSQHEQWIALWQAFTYQQSSYQHPHAPQQQLDQQDYYNYNQNQLAQSGHYMDSPAPPAPQELNEATPYKLSFPPDPQIGTIGTNPNPSHGFSFGLAPGPLYQHGITHHNEQVVQLHGESSYSHAQPISEAQCLQNRFQQLYWRKSELMAMVEPSQPRSPPLSSWMQESRAPANSIPVNDANNNQSDIPPVSNTSKKTTTSAQMRNPAGKPRREAQSQRRAYLTKGKGNSTISSTAGVKRKRQSSVTDSHDTDTSENDSDDDDSVGGEINNVGLKNKSHKQKSKSKPPACKACQKFKTKCEKLPGKDKCERCVSSKQACTQEPRKQRNPTNKRVYLLDQLKQKREVINFLKQLIGETPLSPEEYFTSVCERDDQNAMEHRERLPSSIRKAGGTAGPQAFNAPRGPAAEEDDSDHEESSHPQSFGLVAPLQDEDEDSTDASPNEKLLSSLPNYDAPLGLIANLSLSNTNSKMSEKEFAGLRDDDVGVANETYFLPGPASSLGIPKMSIEQDSSPEILTRELVGKDAKELFKIFFEKVNPFISLLDPDLHTPATTFARCPFLFTVICAISSRFFKKKEIYPVVMHFAKHSAANALIDGWKSVELCQAYILMGMYAVPARQWEEDRSWLYTGLAIRLATDLNLHQVPPVKPQDEKQEREILNGTRVWTICFNLDRSTATQFVKPSTIKEEYMTIDYEDWYKNSKYNLPYDIHLCAYSALLRIVSKWHDEIFSDPSKPTGLNKMVDFHSVTMKYDEQLTIYHDEWTKRFAESSDPNGPASHAGSAFRCRLLPFLVAYSRLAIFSFGFQKAYQRGIQPADHVYITKCLDSAKAVIQNMIDNLAPTGYMRYAPDGHFIFAAFASAFLLKLLRPEFASLLSKDQENAIFELISRLINTLSSDKIAVDERHTPNLYARFLTKLLSERRGDGSTVGRLHLQPRSHEPSSEDVSQHATAIYTTNNTGFSFVTPNTEYPQNHELQYNSQPFHQPREIRDTTPIYEGRLDPTTTGVTQFTKDSGFSWLDSGSFLGEEMLAAMKMVENPDWLENVLMPGFSWD